jgi:hypothetical protein
MRSVRRDRMRAHAPRALAGTLAAVLILAGLRTVVLGSQRQPPPRPSAPAQDLAAEGFAAELSTRYLGYDAAAPDRRARELRALVGEGLGADLGMDPPADVTQRVRWARVVQDQAAIAGGHLITVAVDTDRHGLLHLSVPVRRDDGGRLQLAGYPALIGAPAVAAAVAPARRAVGDEALARVARRAVANYLARDAEDLQADLAPGAQVALPALALAADPAGSDVAVAGPGGVLVTVRARDADGARYTLTYELGVVRTDRWYVTAVQAFPTQP